MLSLRAFRKNDVVLAEAESLRFDVRLEYGSSLDTLGDDPGVVADVIRRRATIPSQPTPRMADGKPDLSGVWIMNREPFPESPARLLSAQNAQRPALPPGSRCLPNTLPIPSISSPWMSKFVQTPTLIVILFEAPPGFRQVFLNQPSHPADPNPSWLGHSIGRWDDDTLIIDTVGLNGQLGFTGATEKLHMVERYRRTDFGHLEVHITFDDPGALSRPLNINTTWDLAAGEDVMEFVCENNRLEHMVGR